jgi:hypothetical protein
MEPYKQLTVASFLSSSTSFAGYGTSITSGCIRFQTANETVLAYNFASGDNIHPHSGNFTIGEAGNIYINDFDGVDDSNFGNLTHTGGADAPDQDVPAPTATDIKVTGPVDLRFKYAITGSNGSSGTIYFIATNGTANYRPLLVSDFPLSSGVTYTFGVFNTDDATAYSSLVPCLTIGTWIETAKGVRFIDDLREGDFIQTRDDHMQPLRWIGRCTVAAADINTPIQIADGVLGNKGELVVLLIIACSLSRPLRICSLETTTFWLQPNIWSAIKVR